MAVEFKTPGGLILPANYGQKSDRSQAAAVRSLGPMGYDTSRFTQYNHYLQAIRIPWVHRVVLKISETFAMNDWNLKDGDHIIADAFNPFLQLMARPNPWTTGYRFLEMFSMYMELLGEAFITLESRDAKGRPRELYLPNPANMIVVPDPVNYIKGYVFMAGGGMGPKIPYEPDEVIHIKMPNPMNPYRGFGAVEASAPVLELISAIMGFESSYFRSGGRIVGVLETDYEVSDDDFLKLKEDWKQFSTDDKQRMKTAILQNGLKYTPIAEGLKNIDVTAINNEKRDTVLGHWGVPLSKLGITSGAAEQMLEGDHVFHSETMQPKFSRWEEDIQPLIDLFNGDWRWEFLRKNFEDDTTKLTNSQKMALTYSFSVDDIRKYNNQDPLENGAGQVIMMPTQMMPMRLEDLGKFADNQLDVSDLAADPPPPPPPPAPAVALMPNTDKPPNDGPSPAVGTRPGKPVGPGAGAKPGGNSSKEIDELYELAAVPGLEEDVRDALVDTIATKTVLAGRVMNRFYRQPKPFRAPGLGTKAVRTVNPNTAATGVYIRTQLMTFMNNAAQNNTGLKKAFRIQRREVLKVLPDVIKAAAKAPAGERGRIIRDALAPVLAAHLDDLKAAIAPIHVAGLVTGFQTGAHVLPPGHAAILRRRMANQKSVSIMEVEGKAEGWQQYVDDWRHDDKDFAVQFDGLLNAAVKNVAEMSLSELGDLVAEGLRRGYSEGQIIGGNADEGFVGITGGVDALEARAEAIVRVEGREAFNAGVAEVLGIKQAAAPAATAPTPVTVIMPGIKAGDVHIALPDQKAPDVHVHMPDQKAPDVHVHPEVKAPDVHVAGTQVDVHVPEQQVDVHIAAPQVDVHVPEQPTPQVTVDVHVPEQQVDVHVQPADVKAPDVNVRVEVPEQKAPDVHVHPEIKAPDVNVDVHVPQQKAPDVHVEVQPSEPDDVTVKYDEQSETWEATRKPRKKKP